MRLEGSLGFMDIARRTPGFVGADLEALMKEAAALAVQRIFRCVAGRVRPGLAGISVWHAAGFVADAIKMHRVEGGRVTKFCPLSPNPRVRSALDASPSAVPEGGLKENVADVEQQPVPRLGQGALTAEELSPLAITAEDVEVAITKVQPSVRREGFATTPNTTWDDVGALADVREELEFAIIKPIMHPELFAAMGLQTGSGILLFGPPGIVWLWIGCSRGLGGPVSAWSARENAVSLLQTTADSFAVRNGVAEWRAANPASHVREPCAGVLIELPDRLRENSGGQGRGARVWCELHLDQGAGTAEQVCW